MQQDKLLSRANEKNHEQKMKTFANNFKNLTPYSEPSLIHAARSLHSLSAC